MRLTKQKAIDISIELWEWLAETGKHKQDWEGWEKYEGMEDDCALCEWITRSKLDCVSCPVRDCHALAYGNWVCATSSRERKKYAKLFLTQLKELKK